MKKYQFHCKENPEVTPWSTVVFLTKFGIGGCEAKKGKPLEEYSRIQEGCFYTMLTSPPNSSISPYSFSCIMYVCTISNTLPLPGTRFLLLPYFMAKFILRVSTHMLPSPGSLSVQLGCPCSCSQHPVLFPII